MALAWGVRRLVLAAALAERLGRLPASRRACLVTSTVLRGAGKEDVEVKQGCGVGCDTLPGHDGMDVIGAPCHGAVPARSGLHPCSP